MFTDASITDYVLLFLLMTFSLGVLFLQNTVHACLSFLGTLLTVSAFYGELKAPFIAISQVLIYAGAILVLFMFVIILFQDAHGAIANYKAKSSPILLYGCCLAFVIAFVSLGYVIAHGPQSHSELPDGFGSVMSIGHALYIDFFFPFEIVVFIFITSLVGALYIGKREA